MEQRAVERKQRREELKRRYEELEKKKRKEQEEQRAAPANGLFALERWQEFVQICLKAHRRHERARLEEAARRYARSLQRRALGGLVRYHHKIQARALSLHRQHRWNTLQRSWIHWSKSFAKELAHQQKVVFSAMTKMQQAKLRRICAQWRKVTSETKLQKEFEREKQQLWRKVRGWLDEDK
ncbi:hypothetical protein AM588_10003544 [Phytophthora nicotianae]|uniref:Uncharacterized protein n=1 Tax=Phytophthora nicotianae TaxID=4792 RepID=A0A0W8D736_PHYNI|nr:hypothetical protein AM588_10003544 [Phytophthora nicotianae]